MAIFGVQLALSMIMASLISKLSGHISLARWLLCNTNLIRYLHPTDDELRELAGVPKDITGKGKGKGKFNKDLKNPDIFHVPRNLELRLDTVKVSAVEVMHLRFYPEYHWAVDYSVYATIVYFCTELYYTIVSSSVEMNLSVYWCLLTLGLCIRVLSAVTSVYFRGDEVIGERAMCLVMGFAYFLIAMIILIVDEDNLELGVDSAYQSFKDNAFAFLERQGVPSVGPASKLIIKFSIATFCGFLGSLFTFPGIRLSKMFWDSLKYCEGRPFLKILLNVTYIMPLLLVVLWIKPVGRQVFSRIPISWLDDNPLMSDVSFESFRMILTIAFVVLRIALMPLFLQSFLNVAQDRLLVQRSEAGRILNTDLQKQVAGIYYYLCIVAVQYITPVLICLQFCFMYKTLGGQLWIGCLSDYWDQGRIIDGNTTTTTISSGPGLDSFLPETDALKPATEHFSLALASLKLVFNETVFRGIFGFATWWCVFLIFASSAVGSAYLSYLSRA